MAFRRKSRALSPAQRRIVRRASCQPDRRFWWSTAAIASAGTCPWVGGVQVGPAPYLALHGDPRVRAELAAHIQDRADSRSVLARALLALPGWEYDPNRSVR